MYRILLILLLVAPLAGCQDRGPTAEHGVLDLRGTDLEAVVRLNGTWHARAGADSLAFAAFEYDAAGWDTVPFPALYTAQGFPDRGLVWYRLHLRLPPGLPPLRARLDYARNAYEVFVARPGAAPVRVAGAGRPALAAEAALPSRQAASFALPSDTALVLTVRTSNHRYGGGGMIAPILLGTETAVAAYSVRRHARVFGVAGACLLLVVTFLLTWLANRRDVAALTVVFLAATTLAREVVTAGALESLIPGVGYGLRVYLETISAWLAAGLFGIFLWALYPLEFVPLRLGRLRLPPTGSTTFDQDLHRHGRPPLPGWRRRLNTAFVLLPATITTVFLALTLVTDLQGLDVLSDIHKALIPGYIVLGFVVALQIVERRRPMAAGFFAGYLLVGVAGAHDLLVRFGLVPGPFASTYAFFAFALILAYLIARRNARNAEFVRRSADVLRQEVTRRTQALHQATKAAEAANEAKSRFLSAVTHELRTPLTAIKGYADLLAQELHARLSPHEREFLATIGNSSDRLVALVNDLLDLDRAESGRLHLTLEDVDLATIADDAIASLYPLAARKSLLLVARHETAPLLVRADAERLRQVLVNLIGNAIKFTDEGRVRVRTGLRASDGVVRAYAAVEDTGPGIAADFLPRLFERFTQDEREERRPGSGLGLAITHELVTRMGGLVEVHTERGVGTTFTVVLPPADDSTAQALAPTALEADA